MRETATGDGDGLKVHLNQRRCGGFLGMPGKLFANEKAGPGRAITGIENIRLKVWV